MSLSVPPGYVLAVQSFFARLPGPGLVSFQVQCSQQEAATAQHDGEGATQEAVLKAEEVLQVGVGALSLQDTGDKSSEVGAASVSQDVGYCDLERLCRAPAPGHHHRQQDISNYCPVARQKELPQGQEHL